MKRGGKGWQASFSAIRMRGRFFPVFGACAMVVLAGSLAAKAEPVKELTILEHPSPEELAEGFARWAERYPDRFSVESRGTTPEGHPILMGRITDFSVPDEDKQIAFLTSAHVAKELNAGTGLLRFMRWLISNDPDAAEIRARQIVLVVPYTDPDHIALGEQRKTRRIYGGWAERGVRLWSIEGVALPEQHPEAVALQEIIDEFRPELHVDFHGFVHAERTMWESTGLSWASAVARSFLHDVPQRIDEAAEAEGFLITRGEQDDGKVRTTGPVEGFPDYVFYLRNSAPIITLYPYARYHTLAFIMEVGYEESLVARAKRALQIGHERGRYERYEGYPVNQVGIHTHIAVSAYGTNAAARRRSRVELWQKLPQLYFGTGAPIPARDTIMAYISTTHEARERIYGRDVSEVLNELRTDPRFDVEALQSVAARFPYTGFGGPRPQRKLMEEAIDEGPIEHGLVLRLLIPYDDAEVTDVRLDGRLIPESAVDGYHIRRHPGTVVEIAIPPEKVESLHIVSCKYETPTVRRPGFTAQDWIIHE